MGPGAFAMKAHDLAAAACTGHYLGLRLNVCFGSRTAAYVITP
jgi:hypothetical protein